MLTACWALAVRVPSARSAIAIKVFIIVPGRVLVNSSSVGTTGSSANAYVTACVVGGTLTVDSTVNGNGADTTEDTLTTYTVPAKQLSVNKDSLLIRCSGSFAGNADTKTLKAYFGGTQIFTTGGLIFNGADWMLSIEIIRTGSSSEIVNVEFVSSSTVLADTVTVSTPAIDLTASAIFKCTGQAGTANANDITQKSMSIKWFPGQ